MGYMLIKYRVAEVAKDFGLTSKDILGILKSFDPTNEYKSMTTLSESELNYVFEIITQKQMDDNFDSFFKLSGVVDKEYAPKQKQAASKSSIDEMSFEEALEESLKNFNTDQKVVGVVLSISPTEVQVDIGRKGAGYIPLVELTDDPNSKPEDIVSIGDQINLIIMRTNDQEGTVMLSKRRFDSIVGWEKIVEAEQSGETLNGTVTDVIDGGLVAVTYGVRVFIPTSHVISSENQSQESLLGQLVSFKILETLESRRRAVGSIRMAMREINKESSKMDVREAEPISDIQKIGSINEVWKEVCEHCKTQVSEVVFSVWIKALSINEISNGKAILFVKTSFQQNVILENYKQLLVEAFEKVLGFPIDIKIIIAEDIPSSASNEISDTSSHYELTFDTFNVHSSNRFAHAAAMAVAENPGTSYNPLFIYGNDSMERTHLMHAISNYIEKSRPAYKIIHIKSDQFVTEVVNAIAKNSTAEFRKKYRQVDVLLIDDIQFVGGKESTQEELYNTFNVLYESKKQIVLSSDRPPKDLQSTADRLCTIFEGGLIADIQPPEFETRVDIIRHKAELLKIGLSDDIVFYIAEQVKTNVKQLENIVQKMTAHHLIGNENLTISLAQTAIRDVLNDQEPSLDMKLCFGTFAKILRKHGIKGLSVVKLVNALTQSIDNNYEVKAGVSLRLSECKTNVPTEIIENSKVIRPENVAEYFSENIVDLLQSNMHTQTILAIREIILKDSSISGNTLIDPINNITKSELFVQKSFVLSDFLAGVFLYTVHSTDNKSGRDAIIEISEDFWIMIASKSEDIAIISTSKHKPIPSKIITNNSAPAPSEYFVGRENECQNIKKHIDEKKGVVLVNGVAGIGKTEICKKLFNEYHNNPNSKIKYLGWINWWGNGSLYDALFQNLSTDLFKNVSAIDSSTSSARLDAIKKVLNDLADNLLLFIDDAHEFSEKDRMLLSGLKCGIVITSRIVDLENAKIIRIGELPSSDCVHLYQNITGQEHDKVIISQIIDRASRVPVVVALFANAAQEIKATDDELLNIVIRNQLGLSSRYLDGELIIDDHLKYIHQILSGQNIIRQNSCNANSAMYSHDQKRILSVSDYNNVCECNKETGECIKTFIGHTDYVRSVIYSPDGQFVLSASEDNTIREWDRETGVCRQVLKGHGSYVRSAVYSPDNQRILSASKDKTIIEWDRETGACLRIFEGHSGSVRSAVYSADGQRILSASGDKTVREWDRKSGECIHIFKGHKGYVYMAAYSPDEQQIISSSGDDTIREWDRNTSACLRVFRGHNSAVNCVVYSPNGQFFLSASKDKTVREWSRETGECLHIFKGHRSAVRSAVYSVDGRWILSAAKDNTIREWDRENDTYMQTFDASTDDIEKTFEDLMKPFHQAIRSMDYGAAFKLLPELKKAEYERYEMLINELGFLFDCTMSLEDNEKSWVKYSTAIKDKVALWNFFKYDYSEATINEIPEIENEYESSEEDQDKPKKETDISQIIGEDLEISVADILKELFRIDSAELLELRKQLAGNQNGFDIRFKYRDEVGLECNCRIECKAGNQQITEGMITDKLEKLRKSKIAENETLHHWILISPKGKKANDLDDSLVIWENENRWNPIQKVQVWNRDCFVEEFFGIVPVVFKKYYPTNKKIAPDKWSDDERKDIIKKWKDKIKPNIPLPKAWKDYFSDHSYLLTHTEHDIKKYNDLYNCHSNMPCLDDAGNIVDKSAEDYIVRWVKRKDNKKQALLILGEYGDGKTFLTYSVSRRLAEEYRVSPGTGTIPLRLTLKDLKGNTSQDFLRARLDSFDSKLIEFKQIQMNHPMVIILDGFDEMSVNMDTDTIAANICRLRDCINDSFQGIKLIITSRTPIYKKFKHLLSGRIEVGETIRLAQISREEKIAYISSHIKNDDVEMKNRFDKLCHTHDLLGLASKALYLDMMKDTLFEDVDIEKLDKIEIYNSYVSSTLNRKCDYLELAGRAVDFPEIFDKLKSFMEDIAIIIFTSYPDGITFDYLTEYHGDRLAFELWKSMTSPTSEDTENMGNCIVNRSLLKVADKGDTYTFCHRSMQEYFAAKALCRMLVKRPAEAADILSKIDFTFETIDFASDILRPLSGEEYERVNTNLISIIEATRGQSKDNGTIARMGSIAISLYFRTWKRLPDIDYSNLVLDNAYLPEADFSNKKLINASLRNANLDNATFIKSDLRQCDLSGVRFEETDDIYSMRVAKDPADGEQYLYVLYSDGQMRKWGVYDGKRADSTGKLQNANLSMPWFGLTLYRNDKISFIKNTEESIEPNGGVILDEDTKILDILNDRILFSKNGGLAIYNLRSRRCEFIGNFPTGEKQRAVIIDDISVLDYTDNSELTIIKRQGETYSRQISVDIKEITAVAIVRDDKNEEMLRIAIGSKQGHLAFYSLDRSWENQKDDNTEIMIKLITHNRKQYLKNICFLDCLRLAYSSTDGIIHVLELDEACRIKGEKQWRLAVSCEDATLDREDENGNFIECVKQQEQYEKLKSYRDSQTAQ